MEIRLLNTEELQQASEAALEGFGGGGEAYQRYVDPDHLWVEMCKNKLFLWGAFENGVLCAVSAMETDGQITIFAVRQAYRGLGLEAMLRREMEQFAVQVRGLRPDDVRMTERWQNAGAQLMAELYSNNRNPWQPYRNEQQAAQQPYRNEQQGARKPHYNGQQPYTDAWSGQPYPQEWKDDEGKRRKTPTGVVIFGIVAAVIAVVVIVWLLVESVVGYWKEQNAPQHKVFSARVARIGGAENGNALWNIGDLGADTESAAEEDEDREPQELQDALGVDFLIPEERIYVAEDLTYTVETQRIEDSDESSRRHLMISVSYPQITFDDGRDASAINGILRDAACVQMDCMYPEPQLDQLIYDDDYLYLESNVYYEITYMSNDILCVAYRDAYFLGNIYSEYYDLRTRVINLSDGTCYELEEVFRHDDALAEAYYEKICQENDTLADAPAFDVDIVGRMLSGEIVDGRMFSNFLLCKDGVLLNMTYHYNDGNLLARGWDKTEWTMEELAEYRTDSPLWNGL